MRLHLALLHSFLILVLIGFVNSDLHALQYTAQQDSIIKIGLLIQDNKSLAARQGAELAILKANETTEYKRKKFQLVVRSMEGPWGTGSKQAVNLIFDEKVAAIMGSHDGRNAHLVEQVATKARIVFLSCWAGDPTLSQAFVPWFFSCVPNNLRQADALVEEVYNKRKLNRIAAISDNGYDSKLAMESFVKKAESMDKNVSLKLYYDIQNKDFNDIVSQIDDAVIDGIILFGQPSASLEFDRELVLKKMNQPIFGTLSLLNEDELPNKNITDYKNMELIYQGNMSGSKGLVFRNEYKKAYGKLPGAVAAYSYDGMNILIEAIRNAGLDRENIQKTISKMRFEGVTGLIQFDDKGKRVGIPGFIEIKNGVPVIPDK